jgi:Phage tail assembly chaperone protein, TAC
MTELISVQALRLCGQCAVLLGWRPDDFWNATPAELAGILSAYAPQAGDTADGAVLCQLMQQFPDAKTGDD